MFYTRKPSRQKFYEQFDLSGTKTIIDNGFTHRILRLANVMEVAVHEDSGMFYVRAADFTIMNPGFTKDLDILTAAGKVSIGSRIDRDPKDVTRTTITNFVASWSDPKRTTNPGRQLLEAFRLEVLNPKAVMSITSNTLGRGQTRTTGPFIALEILPYLLHRLGINNQSPDPRWKPVWDLILIMEKFPLISTQGPRACRAFTKRKAPTGISAVADARAAVIATGRDDEEAENPNVESIRGPYLVIEEIEEAIVEDVLPGILEETPEVIPCDILPDLREMDSLSKSQVVMKFKYYFNRCKELIEREHSNRSETDKLEIIELRTANASHRYVAKQRAADIEKMAKVERDNAALRRELDSYNILETKDLVECVKKRKSGLPLSRRVFEHEMSEDQKWYKIALSYRVENTLCEKIRELQKLVTARDIQIERYTNPIPNIDFSMQVNFLSDAEFGMDRTIERQNDELKISRSELTAVRDRLLLATQDQVKAQYCSSLRGRLAEERIASIISKVLPEEIKLFNTSSIPHHADFTLIYFDKETKERIVGYALIDCKHYQDSVPSSEVSKLEKDIETCRDRYGSPPSWACILSISSQISHNGASRAPDYYYKKDIPILLVHGLGTCVNDDGSLVIRDVLSRVTMYLEHKIKIELEAPIVLRLQDFKSRCEQIAKPARRSRSSVSSRGLRSVSIREPSTHYEEEKDISSIQDDIDDLVGFESSIQSPNANDIREEYDPKIFCESKAMTREEYSVAVVINQLYIPDGKSFVARYELIVKISSQMNRCQRFVRGHLAKILTLESSEYGRIPGLRLR